jgi:sulfite reductase (ferredoxin)
VATVTLPLGDITSSQLRTLADISRRFTRESLRTTVEQNLVIRWVSQIDLPDLYSALKSAGLDQSGAGTIVDIVACPGTDTCKLGISSSRGLAAELRTRLLEKSLHLMKPFKPHIKVAVVSTAAGSITLPTWAFMASAQIGGYCSPFQVVWGNGNTIRRLRPADHGYL